MEIGNEQKKIVEKNNLEFSSPPKLNIIIAMT